MDAMTYIRREFMEEFADNTNRHELGIGLIGKCLGLKRKNKISADIQQQLDLIGAKTYRHVLFNFIIIIIIIFLPLVLHSRESLKINYAIQRWVRSSVRAVCSRQTVVQQNSIEVLHQNINPLKQITGLSSLASTLFDTFLFACSLFCTQLAHQLVKHTCFALLTYDFIFFRSPTHY